MSRTDLILNANRPRNRFKLVIILGFLLLACLIEAKAQLYDVVHRPKVTWHELNSPHFRILYHDGYEDVARRSARLLELAYPDIQNITGGSLERFPVVINGYNDMSNGYVTTLHFRMEVEASPIGGKILNPRTGGHLENLMAHELVHALQFSVKGGIGFTSFLYWFSPDFGRTMHGFTPSGIHEGLAVHAESYLVKENGGRGNFAPFQNQFYSNFHTTTRWNLGQMLTPAGVSRPLDRHYIGGFEFANWLIEKYGDDTIKRSIHSFAKFPLLGYAPHLWYHTGNRPGKLQRQFHEDYASNFPLQKDALEYESVEFYQIPSLRDPIIHYPKWLDDNHIIFFARFYNHTPAFWTYDINQNQVQKVYKTSMEESFQFSLTPDKTKLLYSRYKPHLVYDNTYISDVFELNLERRVSSQVTRNQRLHSPVISIEGNIWALKSQLDTHQLENINNENPTSGNNIYPNNLVQVAMPNDSESKNAVLANKNGIQAVWFVENLNDLSSVLEKSPDISFIKGSIFDLSWSDDSQYLLFGSDHTGIMQIYEYDIENNSVHRLTGGNYNTMEASYSPDNSKIAFIVQKNNGRELVVMNRSELLQESIDESEWKNDFASDDSHKMAGDELLTVSESWETTKYRNDGSWIKPRSIIPISNTAGGDDSRTWGLSLQSSDILRKNSYGLDLEFAHNSVFYDLNYRYSGFFPGINLLAKHAPYDPGNLFDGDNFTFRGEEREIGIGSQIRLNFDHPSTQNYLFIIPEIVRRSSRVSLIDSSNPANNQTTHWFSSDRLRLFTSYALRINQTLRSAQPNNGWIFFLQGDYDIRISENISSPFKGARIGTYFYTSPLSQFNQSLRLGFSAVTQNRPGYNTINIIHEAFNRDDYTLPEKDFFIISSRYTIPLAHPDRGGFLLPGYIEWLYGVLFSESLTNTSFTKSDTILGLGLRGRFRIFYGATFDIGIGYAFQTNKNLSKAFVIDF